MARECALDHSSIRGKFCPECGEKREPLNSSCLNGHPLIGKSKFCAQCGAARREVNLLCSNGHELKPETRFCSICGIATHHDQLIVKDERLTNRNRRTVIPAAGSQEFTVKQANTKPQENSITNNFGVSNLQNSLIDPLAPKQSNIKFVVAGLGSLVAILVIVLFLGSINSASRPVSITVEMTLIDEYDCFDVSWGYADIPNGQVVVDVDGVQYFGNYGSFGSLTDSGCKFTATIYDVDSDGVSYEVSMGNGRRGSIFKTQQELVDSDWTFSLSLG